METAREQLRVAYEAHADAIFRRCILKTGNREVALETTQEVFTRAWEHCMKGGAITNSKAFLFTIANNAIKDYYKKKRPLYEHEHAGESDDLFLIPVEADQELKAEWNEVMRCFMQIESKYRDILVLRFTEGWSVEEIATQLEVRANTVSVWIKRSLQRVRTCLGVETN